jgi:choline dehydrogenase-like flavoprotein
VTALGDSTRLDAIIVGSGAGGCAAAWQLARGGLQVALLEKGHELARDASTLDIDQVVHQGKFKSHERWLDNQGKAFAPEEYFNLGGKTKWYGAALLRYARHEFAADLPHQAPGWPIVYDDLAPYYAQAEEMLGVRNFDCEADLRAIVARLSRRAPGWRHEPLPLGLAELILRQPLEAQHFDGFASPQDLKGDGTTAFLKQVRALPNLRLYTGAPVVDLLAAAGDQLHINGVRLADGTELRARAVLLAAGALHSPRLLERYVESNHLAERLPCQRNLGRNLKLHLLTAMVALAPGRKTDLIRKTTLFLNDRLPHSSVQPLGFDGELIATLMPRLVPRWLAGQLGARAYGFFLQTEDGAHRDNRVLDGSASTQGLPVMDYDASRSPAALNEHRQLVRHFRSALLRTGMLAFSQRIGIGGTAHVSGTMSAGTSPQNSVVDAQGLVHGMNSLYVVDGSVLPRSSRVNPSLSIYAWSLRTAERLATRLRAEAV